MTVILGLTAAFVWATMNIPLQRGARLLDPRVMLFWILLFGTTLVIVVALAFDGLQGPWGPRSLAVPILAGIIGAIGFLFLARALQRGNISTVAPIIALQGGIGVALSVLLGERPSPTTIGLMCIAIAGTILVAYEPGARTAAKGAIWAVCAAFCYAIVLVALGHTDQPALTSAGLVRTISLLAALPLLLIAKNRVPTGLFRLLILAAVLDAVAITAFSFAAAIGPVSIATVAASQFGTAAAVISIIFLRERLKPTQYVGIAVTGLAVSGLGFLA